MDPRKSVNFPERARFDQNPAPNPKLENPKLKPTPNKHDKPKSFDLRPLEEL